MRLLRLQSLAFLPLAACVALGSAPALAQDASSSTGTATVACTGAVQVQDPTRVNNRLSNQAPLDISFVDCENDELLTFPISISGLSGEIQVWGTTAPDADCSLETYRDGSLDEGCVLLASGFTVGQQVIQLSAKDLSQFFATDCVDEGGVNTPHSLDLFFMVMTSDGDIDPSAVCDYTNVRIDLLGPSPPSDVRVGTLDSALRVSFDGDGLADTEGFYAYCDDGTGLDGAGGAPSTTTGGEGGGSSCGASPLLVAGTTPDPRLKKVSASASGVVVTGLENGREYACAITSFDEVLNAGTLSTVVCGTPEPTKDFFSTYKDAGGQAGGGFCSVDAHGEGLAAMSSGIALVLASLVARRRSKKRTLRERFWRS